VDKSFLPFIRRSPTLRRIFSPLGEIAIIFISSINFVCNLWRFRFPFLFTFSLLYVPNILFNHLNQRQNTFFLLFCGPSPLTFLLLLGSFYQHSWRHFRHTNLISKLKGKFFTFERLKFFRWLACIIEILHKFTLPQSFFSSFWSRNWRLNNFIADNLHTNVFVFLSL